MEVADSDPEGDGGDPAKQHRESQRLDPIRSRQLRRWLRTVERTSETETAGSRTCACTVRNSKEAPGKHAGIRPQTRLRQRRLRSVNRSGPRYPLARATKAIARQ